MTYLDYDVLSIRLKNSEYLPLSLWDVLDLTTEFKIVQVVWG